VAFPAVLLNALWEAARADGLGITMEEFSMALAALGSKVNFGLSAAAVADSEQKAAFFRSLHLEEFALAQACALGQEAAWKQFMTRFRNPLIQAATAITGSSSLGHDLADGLYAELYGLREHEGQRKCPLSSYSGRGSLLGWLRTTLAQRFHDYHRRTRREAPLEEFDAPAPTVSVAPDADPGVVSAAVEATLESLGAEDRFLLASYYLDGQTLLQMARLLRVHEATVSRRLKRLASDLRKQLLHHLQAGGMSACAAEEALGTDPRDVEISVRRILQTSQTTTFLDKEGPAQAEPESNERHSK